MTTIASSLNKTPDGLPGINRAMLAQISGFPKQLTRAEFDAAVTAERANITNNSVGIWLAGERFFIIGEAGTRSWLIGTGGSDSANAAASHARSVDINGVSFLLSADACVALKTTGIPTTTAGIADGSIGFDSATGIVYLKSAGAWAISATIGPTASSLGAAVTSGTLGQFASTTSAQLYGIISDETGTGPLVFGTAPTINNANLTGTPTAPTAAQGTNTTQLATMAAVQAAIAALGVGMRLQGPLNASASPNYPAGTAGDVYFISAAGKVGGASGKAVDLSDMLICQTTAAAGAEATVGTSWFVVEHNLIGALVAANNLSDLANTATAWANLGGDAKAQAANATAISTAVAPFTTTSQAAKTFLAAPNGAAGPATFRALVASDLPAGVAPVPITVSGLTAVGSLMTATIAAGWVNTGGNWTRTGATISGATGLTYTSTSADAGQSLTYVSANIPFIPTGVTVAGAAFGVSSTPFFTDTFTGTDGTALTAHTPDLTPGGGWTTPVGTYTIQGGAAKSATNGSLGAVMLAPASPYNDYRVTCLFTGSSGSTNDGIAFRGTDGSNLHFAGHNGSASQVELHRFSGGSETTLVNSSGPSTSSPRTMDAYVVGPVLTVFENGVLTKCAALGSFVNGRMFGFRMAGTVAANSVDNYNAYQVTQGTPFERAFSPSSEKVAWDTDIGTDTDDIMAGLMLHGMVTTGEVQIVCTTTSTQVANSVNALYAINNYKGRSSIPIGVAKSTTNTATIAAIDTVATGTYGTGGPGLAAPDAVTVLRAALNNAAANSLVIICTGFSDNIANLLASVANYGSDGIAQTGLQLVTAKCKRFVWMGGCWGYPSDSSVLLTAESNYSANSGTKTDYIFANWPFATVPVFAVGYELGAVFGASCNTGLANVVRNAWDPTAVLFGVRGTTWGGAKYYGLNQGRGYSLGGLGGFVPDPAANFFIVRESASPTATGGISSQMTALAGS